MRKWIIWVAGILELVVIIVSIIIIAVAKASWWWLFGISMFFFFGDGITAVILFFRSRKIDIGKIEQDPAEIIEKLKYMSVHDKDNPDNFVPQWSFPYSIGERGVIPVKILRVHGYGSELLNIIDFLVNISSEKLEIGKLENKTDEQVKSEMLKMAGYPEADILEERETSYDDLGRPITKVLSKRLSPLQKKEEEEKQKLKEENEL